MSTTQNDLEKIRKEELKALREKLGLHEFIKLLQSYSEGKGDYTKEKYESNYELTIENFEKYMKKRTLSSKVCNFFLKV